MAKPKRPKSVEIVLKTLCYLRERDGSDSHNYFAVQAHTDRFNKWRKVPIDLVSYAAWRFLEPEGLIKTRVDTKNWSGNRFIYTLTAKGIAKCPHGLSR